jgi:hypothetical protein
MNDDLKEFGHLINALCGRLVDRRGGRIRNARRAESRRHGEDGSSVRSIAVVARYLAFKSYINWHATTYLVARKVAVGAKRNEGARDIASCCTYLLYVVVDLLINFGLVPLPRSRDDQRVSTRSETFLLFSPSDQQMTSELGLVSLSRYFLKHDTF